MTFLVALAPTSREGSVMARCPGQRRPRGPWASCPLVVSPPKGQRPASELPDSERPRLPREGGP
jgi:hypothetical protein